MKILLKWAYSFLTFGHVRACSENGLTCAIAHEQGPFAGAGGDCGGGGWGPWPHLGSRGCGVEVCCRWLVGRWLARAGVTLAVVAPCGASCRQGGQAWGRNAHSTPGIRVLEVWQCALLVTGLAGLEFRSVTFRHGRGGRRRSRRRQRQWHVQGRLRGRRRSALGVPVDRWPAEDAGHHGARSGEGRRLATGTGRARRGQMGQRVQCSRADRALALRRVSAPVRVCANLQEPPGRSGWTRRTRTSATRRRASAAC